MDLEVVTLVHHAEGSIAQAEAEGRTSEEEVHSTAIEVLFMQMARIQAALRQQHLLAAPTSMTDANTDEPAG